jgi:hypothetical protein
MREPDRLREVADGGDLGGRPEETRPYLNPLSGSL